MAETTLADSQPAVSAHGHVTSRTPGRLRVRVHHPQHHQHTLGRAQAHLRGQAGIGQVETNSHTGSVLVHYDPRSRSPEDVLAALRDAGLLIEDVAKGVGEDVPETGPGRSTTSESVVDVVTDLDRQLSALTGRKVDLKLLFPATLGGIGLWQAVTRGIGLADVPAYVLLWYAFDSFWKFHREPPHGTRSEPAERANGHHAAPGEAVPA